jgi:hypothetical protein
MAAPYDRFRRYLTAAFETLNAQRKTAELRGVDRELL